MNAPPSRLQRAERGAFAALTAFTLGLYLAHLLLDDSSTATAAFHAAMSWGGVFALPLLPWAGRLGGRGPALAAGLASLAALLSALPGASPWPAPRGEARLRVLTANVLMVHPDPDALLDELVALDADVIALQEVSPAWADALQRRAALGPWRWRRVIPQEDSFGIALLARLPAQIEEVDLLGVTALRATIEVDGRPVEILNVHTLPPRLDDYTERWHAQMDALADMVVEHPAPIVVLGDLNATRHHPSYRRLLRAGLRDAHAEVGRGWAWTWPNGVFPLPPLRLDHVLVNAPLRALAVREGEGRGSDHRPVVADLGWAAP